MKLIRRTTLNRMKGRLERLYGSESAEHLIERLYMIIGRYGVLPEDSGALDCEVSWSEKDSILITYGDSIQRAGDPPLNVLNSFCNLWLKDAVNTIHILPFSPSSSDAGFSVIDYRKIAPELGTWDDVSELADQYRIMADLVLNHCSSKNRWFKNYTNGIYPYKDYFIEVDPKDDRLKQVVRPRPSPLLTKIDTSEGLKHVWATFSPDQIDMNWKSPEVLFEFMDIILFYLSKGVKILRLDAVAFLWKTLGTNCVHLPQTHEVIKFLRDLLTSVAPDVVLLTETNVPHQENISYFGAGDEAHMVYQFALPPLLAQALLSNQSDYLQKWANSLEALPENCTYLNFTSSHDGVGLRPLSGLIPEEEVDSFVESAKERGGLVSYRSMPDGSETPYEINVTYYDLLSDLKDEALGIRRFLCAQTVMLSLQGIPAVYLHSFVGEKNWIDGPSREHGENRDINRKKLAWEELVSDLEDPESIRHLIYRAHQTMLTVRSNCSAFHPQGAQEILPTASQVFAVIRTSPDQQTKVLCCFNFTEKEVLLPKEVVASVLGETTHYSDLLRGQQISFSSGGYDISPYGCEWLINGSL